MKNKKNWKKIFIKIIALLGVISIILLALTPLLAILGK